MTDPSNADSEFSAGDPSSPDAALISDLQHRFRNDLQLVSSLLGLQAHRIARPEIVGMLGQMQNRIRAIAYMHSGVHPFYGGSPVVHLGDYLNQLAGELSGFHELGGRVRIQVSAADLALIVDQALPVALIANELVSNAFQHAFPGDRRGLINVALLYVPNGGDHSIPHRGELLVEDDGVGLPPGVSLPGADSLGFHLVRTLARQLDAQVSVKGESGTSIRVLFPLPPEE